MGNTNDNTGFHESDEDDENKDVEENAEPITYIPDPPDRAPIYQSQYAMNLYGVTDSGEFVTNAVRRIPKQNHVHKIKTLFKYKKKLGEGASGKVLLVQQKFGEQNKCALKELHRKHKVNSQLFLREVVILELLKHPNILELYDVYLDKSSYYIATAYYSGGEFFDRIIKTKKFSEKEALKYIKPILSAVHFMHEKAVVHRDLKPSNMVFDKKGKNGQIKIIDFGTSEIVIDEDLYTAERVGTILYAPPEWKRDRIGSHLKKGDLWSLGVIVYVLMVGRLPFGEWKHIESFNNDLWFPKKLKQKLSYQCIDFILKCLERYAEQRLSAKQALRHPWITKDDASQLDEDLGADLKHGLQSVHAESTIAKAIGKVNNGALSLKDLDPTHRAIVYENVKNQKDVEKYLKMYNEQNAANVRPNHAQAAMSVRKPKYHAPPPQSVGYNVGKFGSKDIMESIHRFREIEHDDNGVMRNVFNEDMDDDEYEKILRGTLKSIGTALNEEEKEKELLDMLGADYEALKPAIDQQHRIELEKQKEFELQRKNTKTHKNAGNPLNIQCEEDEEFAFDETIVKQLMDIGLATRHACIRAVLATNSKGVNEAAEWLLNHQNDHGINEQVDVL